MISNMIQILKHLGVTVKEEDSSLIIDSTTINNFYIAYQNNLYT